MTNLAQALRDFVTLFESIGTPYAVMGGIAVRVYGIPRPTHDIDFTLAIDRSRLPELYRALQKLGYTVAEEYLRGSVDEGAGMPLVKARLYLENRAIDIDVFLSESRFQEQVLSRRRREQIEDTTVWLVSPEDLILLKLLAHRPRDIANIGDILFTQGQLDEEYMRSWAKELGVLEKLDKVLADRPAV